MIEYLSSLAILSFVALMSTINTSVLFSSIFFIADSVVNGCLMIEYLSSLAILATDLRGALGLRAVVRVLGRKKWTLVRTLRVLRDTLPLTALETFDAFFALLG